MKSIRRVLKMIWTVYIEGLEFEFRFRRELAQRAADGDLEAGRMLGKLIIGDRTLWLER